MNILIIGAGFVGLNAFYALKENYNCLCTVRSYESLKKLKEEEIPCIILDSQIKKSIESALISQDIAIIAVAPSGNSYEETYLKLAENISLIVKNHSTIKQIIILSSTSVYAESNGNRVNEDSKLDIKEEKPNILIKTENLYLDLQNNNIDVCIFRLGEIYGKSRSLINKMKKIQGTKIPGNGEQFVNIVHVDDIIFAIQFAIKTKLRGIYNLVSDNHPKRKELYDQICEKTGFFKPIFEPKIISHHGKNKIVENEKIKSIGFSFQTGLKILEP